MDTDRSLSKQEAARVISCGVVDVLRARPEAGSDDLDWVVQCTGFARFDNRVERFVCDELVDCVKRYVDRHGVKQRLRSLDPKVTFAPGAVEPIVIVYAYGAVSPEVAKREG